MTQWCAIAAFIATTVPVSWAGTQLELKAEQRKGMPEGCMTNAQVNAENVSQMLLGRMILSSDEGSTSGFDCSDCGEPQIYDVQSWCQSRLPDKCWA